MSRDPLRVHRLIDPQHIGPAGGSFLQSRLGGVVDGLAQQRQRLRLPQAAGALRQQAGLVIPPLTQAPGADRYPGHRVERSGEVLRRAPGEAEPASPAAKPEKDDTLRFPGLTVSLASYEVTYEGKPVEMPPKELEVLYYLASHPNMVFTRDQLLEQVWGYNFFGDSRTVDVHIKRLREKLPECEKYGWEIHTVWRVGYKFDYKPA